MNKSDPIEKTARENQDHSDAYYEERASQEEIYLEEGEERAREVLIAESISPSLNSGNGSVQVTNAESNRSEEASVVAAAEALITGDSDDPPLSDEVVEEMLKPTQGG